MLHCVPSSRPQLRSVQRHLSGGSADLAVLAIDAAWMFVCRSCFGTIRPNKNIRRPEHVCCGTLKSRAGVCRSLGECRPECGPKSGQVFASLPRFRPPLWAVFDQLRPIPAGARPNSAKIYLGTTRIGPDSAKFCQYLLGIGQHWPGAALARSRRNLARFCQFRPGVAGVRPKSTRMRPKLARRRLTWPEFESKVGPKIGQHWPGGGQRFGQRVWLDFV